MFLLCISDSCVRSKENIWGRNSLDFSLWVFLWLFLSMTCLIFVGDPAYLLGFWSLSGLCPRPVFDSLYVDCVVFLEVVYFDLLVFF